MFELTDQEVENMVSQFVIPDKKLFGGALPFAFTEQGVAMLSSVLNSKLAIQINIQIMRVFTRMRQLLVDNTEVKLEIAEIKHTVEQISRRQKGYDKNIELLFEYIDRLQDNTQLSPSKGITVVKGFDVGNKKV